MGMTTNEAIEILRKNRPTSDPRPCGMELCDAVDMAISALRQQDVTDKYVGKMTNAQKIRAMTDEELGVWICKHALSCGCCVGVELCRIDDGIASGAIKWLQQPAEED